MNVRTKIFLLLGAVIALFVSALFWHRWQDARHFERLAQERLAEREAAFLRVLDHWGEPLDTFVRYQTCWDALVAAVRSGDADWFRESFDDSTLASYRTHVIWIYSPEGAVLFTRNLLYTEDLAQAPVPASMLPELVREQKLVHFFARTPSGLLEVRGGGIHPSRDVTRSTDPGGYLLAARLWGQEDLQEMALFTGTSVVEANAAEAPPPAAERNGTVSFSKVLSGWDGAPVAALAIRAESPEVQRFQGFREQTFFWLLGLALLIPAFLAISLRLWVWSPLVRFSKSLRTGDVGILRDLERDRCEVGDLARLIRAFFEQKETLLTEIHERQQAEARVREREEQLRHAQKMEAIGRLAGGVAHDFNNLLTAIMGYADLLRQKLSVGQPARQHADLVLVAAEKAAGLTKQLLAFSRKQVLHPRVVDLNELVREMEKLLIRVIGEQIELRVETRATNPRLCADPTQLEQVIMNLAVNARDAMPDGGVLTISTADAVVGEGWRWDGMEMPGGRFTTLSVRDTGCGMDETTRQRIFEPFFTTKDAGRGTGLGLSTVYGIVRQSGGALTVESAPGRGAAFHVMLPSDCSAAAMETASPALPEVRSGHGETILLAEDDPIVRSLVASVLQEHGYHVLEAEDGKRALDLARQTGDFQLLITDIVMPRLNGPGLVSQLRAFQPHVPVLFISGYADEAAEAQCAEHDRCELLRKPFTSATLTARVHEVLQQAMPHARSS